ncbi:hypothetical protein BH18ACT9_BH18ACT9_18950 [soil metagenome]
MSTRRALRVALDTLVVSSVVALSGCGPETVRGDVQSNETRSESSSASPGHVEPAETEQLAGVELPSGAEVVTSQPRKGVDLPLVHLLVFETTPADAETFCADFGLGGSLVSSAGLTEEDRALYGVRGGSEEPVRRCEAVRPDDPAVNRSVLITYPTAKTATVHLVALTVPR